MKASVPELLEEYGLLQSDIILSHACGSTAEELQTLREAGTYISSTPATESQMAHGQIVGFREHVLGSIGADCECANIQVMATADDIKAIRIILLRYWTQCGSDLP